MAVGGRWPRAIDAERLLGHEQPVESVGDEIDANRGDDQPRSINRFAPIERYDRERNGTQYGDPCP